MSTLSPKSGTVDPRADAQWTAADFQLVDGFCERFEQSWQAGCPLDIHAILAAVDPGLARLLLRELLAIDIEYKTKRGETSSLDLLRDQFPDQQDVVAVVCAESSLLVQEEAVPEILRQHPRYEITGRLGQGGMGTVYAGKHNVLGRDVAIKVIRRDFLTTPGARDRFLKEARTAALIHHPNVVTVYDAEATDSGQFLVMELVSGADLGKTVQELGPLPWQAACDAIQQAALGLAAGRKNGMVHRDLSPRNLMLADDGTVKLLDFGLASLSTGLDSAEQLFSRGMLVGSAAFISPEQAADPSSSDVRSDLYSLGCVMYFLLAGRPPFTKESIPELLDAHRLEPVPNIREICPDIPADVAGIVTQLISKSPEDRFQTPTELAAVLEPYCDRESAAPVSLPESKIPVPSSDRSRQFRQTTLMFALILLAIGIAWGYRELHRGNRKSGEIAESPEFVQGLSLLGQRQERQVRLAIEKLQRVVARDSHDARAFAALAEAHNLCGDYGWVEPDVAFPLAIAAAQRALEIDPRLAEARLALAFADSTYNCDWAGAERQYREVLSDVPDSPSAHHWLAWVLMQQKRFDEALGEIALAQQLAPDNLIIANNFGKLLYFSRKFEAAAKQHRVALELDQDFQKAHRDLGYALIELGQFEEAMAAFDRSAGISDRDWDVQAARTYARARQGKLDLDDPILQSLEEVALEEGLSFELADIYAAAEETDRAFFWLETAFARKAPGRAEIAVDPRLDPLRGDPRFAPLIQSIGLTK